MIKKLLIILTLLAGLWCAAALADDPDYAFTSQPAPGAVLSDDTIVYTWDLNFTPTRTVIMNKSSGRTYYSQTGLLTTYNFPNYDEFEVRAYYSDTGYITSDSFTPRYKTITFDPRGARGYMEPVKTTSSTYTLPACSFWLPSGLSDVYFDGWAVNDLTNGSTQPGTVIDLSKIAKYSSGITLYANWHTDNPSSTYCMMVFDLNDGTGNVITHTSTSPIYIPSPTDEELNSPEGKMLSVWIYYSASSVIQYGPGSEVYASGSSNRRLNVAIFRACWTKRCTLTFDPNGGTGEMEPIVFPARFLTTDANYPYWYLPESTFTPPEGKTFRYWRINGQIWGLSKAAAFDDDVVAYAVWLGDNTITFDGGGAEGSMADVVLSNESDYTLPTCGFTAPDGFSFAGWELGGEIYQPQDVLQCVTTNLTLTAVWNNDSEGFYLFGQINGEQVNCGSDADGLDMQLEPGDEPGVWTLRTSFTQDSYLAVKHYFGSFDQLQTVWYSAAAPGESAALLTDRGPTTDTAAMLPVAANLETLLTLTDNGDGSYTLTAEPITDFYIEGSVTDWERALLEYNETTGLYEYTVHLDPEEFWGDYVYFYLILNDEYYYTTELYDSFIIDSAAGLPVTPSSEIEENCYEFKLCFSEEADYIIAFDLSDMTVSVSTNAQNFGYYLITQTCWAPIRMVDPLTAGEDENEFIKSKDDGDSSRNLYLFENGTTLWARQDFYEKDVYPGFHIATNGQIWGCATPIAPDTDIPTTLTAGIEAELTSDDTGERYDFYFCPETHQLVVQRYREPCDLVLYTWCEDTSASVAPPYYTYDEESENVFTISPSPENGFVQGDVITIAAPAIDGYTCVGWIEGYVSSWYDGNDMNYHFYALSSESCATTATYTFEIEGDTELVAIYVTGAGNVTVTYDAQGGTAVSAQTVPVGGYAAAPVSTKIGAYLTGWFTDAACAYDTQFVFSSAVTTDLTLYAGWAEPEPASILWLPDDLTQLGSEAFEGIAAEAVVIPAGVTVIDGNPFDGSAIQYVYGFPGTAAETMAGTYTFIPIDQAWLSSH